jgi:TonB family protein
MVVALADPPSFLERRIRLITARARIPSLRRVAGLALVAGSLVVLAVCTRDPMAVDDASVEAVSAEAAAGPTFTPFTVPPRLLNVSEVQTLLEQRYPSDLRASGVGGTVDMSFFLEDDGSILSLQVRDGSGVEALDRAAVEIASAMRFTPAMNRDEAVRVWISLPVTFRSEAPTATEPVKPNGDPLEQAVDSSDEAVESAGDPEPASVESAAGGAAELDANPARLRDRIDSFPAGDAIDAETRTERMRQVLDESPDITLTRTTVHGPTSVSGADFQTAAAAVERASDGGTVLSGMDQPEADSEQPSRSPFTARPELQNLAEIQTLIEQEYPPLLRDAGIGGRADVLMLIDSNGNIVRTQLAEGTGQPALDEAALRVAAASRFTPARNEGEATTVWVSLPIAFVSR